MCFFLRSFWGCLLFFLFSFVAVSAGQEEVTTEGYGSGVTKVSACEVALDHARREAIQTASTIVESNYESIETNGGVSARSDTFVTSKAFARLIKKAESASFDPESGRIDCKVVATFKAGFVTSAVENMAEAEKQATHQETGKSSVAVQDFTAGEVWCSKEMNRCFREIYSKQIGVFGIQALNGGKDDGGAMFDLAPPSPSVLQYGDLIVGLRVGDSSVASHTYEGKGGSSADGRGALYVRVTTMEEFKEYVVEKERNLTSNTTIYFRVDVHKWYDSSRKHRSQIVGFDKKSSDWVSVQGRLKKSGMFTSTPEVDKKKLAELDAAMNAAMVSQ